MKLKDYYTIDFETEKIESRPKYPPVPGGVSVKRKGKTPRYFAWGHDTKNNCTKSQAIDAVRDVYRSGLPLLFQNGSFDVDVADVHFRLKPPQWDRIHDTLYLLFLNNPHARSLSLKPSAEEILGMKPEERDAVFDWMVDHGILKKDQKKRVGEHFMRAPGDLVGRYSNGDTIRTEKLFDHLLPKMDEGMLKAYDRERRLMPILLRNEKEGMRVDVRKLEKDVKKYEKAQRTTDKWLRKRLKAPDLNLNSDAELVEALDRAGVVKQWAKTKSGKRSTSKKNMTVDLFKDKRVYAALGYRNRLETCLGTFMRPWLEMARANNGYIYTHWNQVRQTHGDESTGGTRTGRLSCTPNFQNIPKDWYDKNDGFSMEIFELIAKLIGVPPLPLMRKYILPDEGGVFIHRDYNQQEPRILGHFENDKLCNQYNTDPRTDVHSYIQQEILNITGMKLERRPVKILNLGIIYGMGLEKLAAGMGVDVATAKKIKAAHSAAIPGLKELDREIKFRGRSGQAVRTWGGRLYYSEPPKMMKNKFNGRMELKTFEYKLLNYLIQGSAADCTKEALIRYDDVKKEARFMVTVHDECNASAPKKRYKEELIILRDVMESIEFDVKMVTDAKAGPTWGALKKVDE